MSRKAAVIIPIIPTENSSWDNFITLSADTICAYDTNKTVDSAWGKNCEANSTQAEKEEYASATNTQFIIETVRTECNSRAQRIKLIYLNMIAVYVAYRDKKKISWGPFMNPIVEWLRTVFKMDKDFLEFHGTCGFNETSNVMKTLVNILCLLYTSRCV